MAASPSLARCLLHNPKPPLPTPLPFHHNKTGATAAVTENSQSQLQCRFLSHSKTPIFSIRRSTVLRNAFLLAIGVRFPPVVGIRAEEEEKILSKEKVEMEGGGLFGALESFFDPNEKVKSGKVLPKAYLKSAREVVKSLRESLKEDGNDVGKFRKSADEAKEAIKEFLNEWQGKVSVTHEESYVAVEKAIRSLAGFYMKAGPLATLPEQVRNSILVDLDAAEAFL